MTAARQRVYTAAERAARIAAARTWKGTHTEFASQHGVSWGTLASWRGSVDRREYTDAERAQLVADLRTWKGTQTAFAVSRGIPQTTLSRWVNADRRTRRASSSAPLVRPDTPPAMVEVVAAPAVRPSGESRAAGARVLLADGVVLALDELPPARWIAELAVELRRC